jgi:ATP-binding cassette subfamily F protein 3
MTACSEYIKNVFPLIDDDLKHYVEGVLKNGADDFQDSEEVYDAIGEVLQEVSSDKTEDDIRTICNELLNMLKPDKSSSKKNGPTKVLNAPIHLASMAANLENDMNDIKSIWVMHRDDTLKVDAKKLEKAEAKLQEKQEKRSKDVKTVAPVKLETATASQVKRFIYFLQMSDSDF